MKNLLALALLLGAFFPAPASSQSRGIDWIRPPICRVPGHARYMPCVKPTPKPKPVKPLRCKHPHRPMGMTIYIPCVKEPKAKPKGNGAVDGNSIENRVNNGLYTNEVWNKLNNE